MARVLEEAADALEGTWLFKGISREELPEALDLVGATVNSYAADEVVLAAGSPVTSVYAVVSGRVRMLEEDVFGNRTIFGEAGPGNVFAEALAAVRIQESFVTVQAVEDSRVLGITLGQLLKPSVRPGRYRDTMIRNLVQIMAKRNMQLHRKLGVLSCRRTRDKVMSYLDGMAKQTHSRTFDIPLSRQELADYLCVDRSALSSELSRMRQEGLIDFKRNHFRLL